MGFRKSLDKPPAQTMFNSEWKAQGIDWLCLENLQGQNVHILPQCLIILKVIFVFFNLSPILTDDLIYISHPIPLWRAHSCPLDSLPIDTEAQLGAWEMSLLQAQWVLAPQTLLTGWALHLRCPSGIFWAPLVCQFLSFTGEAQGMQEENQKLQSI